MSITAPRYCPPDPTSLRPRLTADDHTSDVSYLVTEVDHDVGSASPLASHDDLATATDHVARLVACECASSRVERRPIRYSYFWRPVERVRSTRYQVEDVDTDRVHGALIRAGVDVDAVAKFLVGHMNTLVWDGSVSDRGVRSERDLATAAHDLAVAALYSSLTWFGSAETEADRVTEVLIRSGLISSSLTVVDLARRLLEISGINRTRRASLGA